MDLLEHQAKELFAKHGVPIPPGKVAAKPEEAQAIAKEFVGSGDPRVVIKAQVKTGGRGKAGGVKLADDADDALARAGEIIGMDIKGHTVEAVLVEQASAIAEEYYFSFLLDRANQTYLAIASRAGGMDIEEVASQDPEAVIRVPISPLTGLDSTKAREIAVTTGLPERAVDGAAELIAGLWDVFVAEDATLVEVNPMILTDDGRVVALDAKVTLDDNAAFRHDHTRFAGGSAADDLEGRAKSAGLNYVKLDGEVGIIGNGAGLVMSTLDVVAYAGQDLGDGGIHPANFLDIGGGASAEVMAAGLEIILSDPSVRSVFVNVFGGITACDAVATGIASATQLLKEGGEPVDRPIVVRLDGNNRAAGRRILSEAGISVVEQVENMDDAARRAGQLAAGRA